MPPLFYLQLALALFTIAFVVAWIKLGRPQAEEDRGPPRPVHLGLGFVINFFDTLGIGSFAPTTASYRLLRVVPDERIPGTMNVGHTLPTILQAFIYTDRIEVDFVTLVALIVAAVLGAWLGAGVVARWPRRRIQIGMGIALVVAATLFTLTNLGVVAGGGTALGVTGGKLALASAGNFALGALMTLGIGLYGPCLIMISLLGMDPRVSYPIMMGSCAFLMVVAGIRFLRAEAYRQRPAIGLTLGGLPAVYLAATFVASLEVSTVRWLVVIVVLYTAILMLRSAFKRA
jgi:uncharacterized membrane protein YfcA